MINFQLTAFQTKARQAVLGKFEERMIDTAFNHRGAGECYLFLELPSHALRIWIYEDEAELRTSTLQRFYERESFGSEDELLDAFLQDLAKEIPGEGKVGQEGEPDRSLMKPEHGFVMIQRFLHRSGR